MAAAFSVFTLFYRVNMVVISIIYSVNNTYDLVIYVGRFLESNLEEQLLTAFFTNLSFDGEVERGADLLKGSVYLFSQG